MPTIHTPVGGFTGTVAGVHFKDGKGDTDDPQALAYFARKGYDISGAVKPPVAFDDEPEGQEPEPQEFDDDRPAKSASKAEWAEYAKANGVNNADELTKAEIIERFE